MYRWKYSSGSWNCTPWYSWQGCAVHVLQILSQFFFLTKSCPFLNPFSIWKFFTLLQTKTAQRPSHLDWNVPIYMTTWSIHAFWLVLLFGNRWWKTSKCYKNVSDPPSITLCAIFLVLLLLLETFYALDLKTTQTTPHLGKVRLQPYSQNWLADQFYSQMFLLFTTTLSTVHSTFHNYSWN